MPDTANADGIGWGLRGEDSIAELCRREGIVQNLYYRWSKDFLEAGKQLLDVFMLDMRSYRGPNAETSSAHLQTE